MRLAVDALNRSVGKNERRSLNARRTPFFCFRRLLPPFERLRNYCRNRKRERERRTANRPFPTRSAVRTAERLNALP